MHKNSKTLETAVAAHRAGRLDEARALYEAAARERPANSHAMRGLGQLEFQSGRYPAAVRHFEAASHSAPDDSSIRVELSRALAADERLKDAATVLEDCLLRFGENASLRFNLAMIQLRDGEPASAAASLERVLDADPAHRKAIAHLSRIYQQTGRTGEAASLLERALAAEPEDRVALLGLAALREDQGQEQDALDLLERAAAVATPDAPEAHVRFSRLLEHRGDESRALAVAIAGTELCGGHDIAWRHLGDLLKRLDRLPEAVAAFERAHAILRKPGTRYGLDRPEIRRTTRAKLRHDIEQLEYLRDRGVPVPGLEQKLEEHRRLAAALPADLQAGDVVGLPPNALTQLGGNYNRCMHRATAPEIEAGALNPGLDTAAIVADYRERQPGITWIDDFLRPEAVESLRRYLLESTIWYDADHPNGYVGTYLHDGFTCPLVLQIARELPALLPAIFGDRPLLQLWAYHYDSHLAGIGMHADFAAVNVNFWLTPTESMLDQESGGMVVWNKEAPKDWTYRDYNTADPDTKRQIDTFLDEAGAQQIRIPHRQNRVVIFNSDLFHRTDDIRFMDGFENRRINVTMLYGHRDREG